MLGRSGMLAGFSAVLLFKILFFSSMSGERFINDGGPLPMIGRVDTRNYTALR